MTEPGTTSTNTRLISEALTSAPEVAVPLASQGFMGQTSLPVSLDLTFIALSILGLVY